MRTRWLSMLAFALTPLAAAGLVAQESAPPPAQDSAGSQTTAEEFEAKLGYTTGTTVLKDGLATLNLPESFRFLGPEGSKRLLEEGWGNPKGSGDDVLGMLVPAGISPLADSGWAVVITYEEEGYIDDKGAGSIDYAKLLKQMQDATEKDNKARSEEGYETVTLVGWAEPPSYDSVAHNSRSSLSSSSTKGIATPIS